MKTLFLLRHASAASDPPGGGDRERRLSESGIYEAQQTAKQLRSLSQKPSAILCSSAHRTVETLQYLRAVLAPDLTVRIEDDLYLAGSERLLRAVAEADDTHESLLVLAHNPGIAELAHQLVNAGDEALRARLQAGFPPASLVRMELAAENWAEARPQAARLIDFSRPRDLH